MREGFRAPKQSLESGTQKVCLHFFRPLFLSRPRVPKMGPQNRPLAQPWCAKCPGLTDPHLVAYLCAAAIAAATRQPIYWLTFRPLLAEALSRSKPAASFVLSQRSPLVAAAPCMRERLGSEKRWKSLACTYVWSRVERPGCHMKTNGVALLFMQVFVCRNGDCKRSTTPCSLFLARNPLHCLRVLAWLRRVQWLHPLTAIQHHHGLWDWHGWRTWLPSAIAHPSHIQRRTVAVRSG